MDIESFAAKHLAALETDEIRFGVAIAVLSAALRDRAEGFLFWDLGGPGHCAIKSPGRAIVLGALDQSECKHLAGLTRDIAYPGVTGVDETPSSFVEFARGAGAEFGEPIPMRVHALKEKPRYPGARGVARIAGADDAPLLFEWLSAFRDEATPHEAPASPEMGARAAASGRYVFWLVDGRPVAMAGIMRSLARTVSIGGVYTPPDLRGRGYAGSVTAALCESAFAMGKDAVTLFTDLRNPWSNRCYAKIGFKPQCEAWHFARQTAPVP